MAKKKATTRGRRISLQRTVDSVIVHDMKNLAFRLGALLQNMDEHYENPLFKTSVMEVLGDTVRKMNTIVKHFRDHGEHVILKLRININDILGSLIQTLPPRVLRHIRVNTEFEEIPPVWGDSFYLREAFHNLMENAIEAMPNGGTLTVRTQRKDTRKKARIAVEITDTGIGMSQSFLENKLFKPFVTTKENGMGLGLFTTQQIFAIHHGKMEVETSPGDGTTFRIIFPADPGA